MLFGIISLVGVTSPAFADSASVSAPAGTSVPGCEETNECYIPYEVTVDAGGEVTWTNDDSAAHTVTAGNAADGLSGEFDSGLFMAGATFTHKFENVGTFPYFCMVHPWMEGIVVVQEAEAEESPTTEPIMAETPEAVPIMEETPQLDPIRVEGARTFIDVGNSALFVETSGDKVYVTNPKDGKIHVIDVNTNEILNTIDSEIGVIVVEAVPEKNQLYATVDSLNKF